MFGQDQDYYGFQLDSCWIQEASQQPLSVPPIGQIQGGRGRGRGFPRKDTAMPVAATQFGAESTDVQCGGDGAPAASRGQSGYGRQMRGNSAGGGHGGASFVGRGTHRGGATRGVHRGKNPTGRGTANRGAVSARGGLRGGPSTAPGSQRGVALGSRGNARGQGYNPQSNARRGASSILGAPQAQEYSDHQPVQDDNYDESENYEQSFNAGEESWDSQNWHTTTQSPGAPYKRDNESDISFSAVGSFREKLNSFFSPDSNRGGAGEHVQYAGGSGFHRGGRGRGLYNRGANNQPGKSAYPDEDQKGVWSDQRPDLYDAYGGKSGSQASDHRAQSIADDYEALEMDTEASDETSNRWPESDSDMNIPKSHGNQFIKGAIGGPNKASSNASMTSGHLAQSNIGNRGPTVHVHGGRPAMKNDDFNQSSSEQTGTRNDRYPSGQGDFNANHGVKPLTPSGPINRPEPKQVHDHQGTSDSRGFNNQRGPIIGNDRPVERSPITPKNQQHNSGFQMGSNRSNPVEPFNQGSSGPTRGDSGSQMRDWYNTPPRENSLERSRAMGIHGDEGRDYKDLPARNAQWNRENSDRGRNQFTDNRDRDSASQFGRGTGPEFGRGAGPEFGRGAGPERPDRPQIKLTDVMRQLQQQNAGRPDQMQQQQQQQQQHMHRQKMQQQQQQQERPNLMLQEQQIRLQEQQIRQQLLLEQQRQQQLIELQKHQQLLEQQRQEQLLQQRQAQLQELQRQQQLIQTQQLQRALQMQEQLAQQQLLEEQKKAAEASKPLKNEDVVESKPSDTGNDEYNCKVCALKIRGLMAYLVHVQCKEHQDNLAKQREIDKLPPSLRPVQPKVAAAAASTVKQPASILKKRPAAEIVTSAAIGSEDNGQSALKQQRYDTPYGYNQQSAASNTTGLAAFSVPNQTTHPALQATTMGSLGGFQMGAGLESILKQALSTVKNAGNTAQSTAVTSPATFTSTTSAPVVVPIENKSSATTPLFPSVVRPFEGHTAVFDSSNARRPSSHERSESPYRLNKTHSPRRGRSKSPRRSRHRTRSTERRSSYTRSSMSPARNRSPPRKKWSPPLDPDKWSLPSEARKWSPHRNLSPVRRNLSPSHGRNVSQPRDRNHSPPRGYNLSPPRARNQSPPRARNHSPPRARNHSPPRARNHSPPRARNHSPPHARNLSPPRARNLSPPRARHLSPPRSRNLSPPRARNLSPPRARNLSPPRAKNLSPPRARNVSPPRARHLSPPRARNQSPPRVRNQSPPRVRNQSSPRIRNQSPPRVRNQSPPRARNLSPPRSRDVGPPRSTEGDSIYRTSHSTDSIEKKLSLAIGSEVAKLGKVKDPGAVENIVSSVIKTFSTDERDKYPDDTRRERFSSRPSDKRHESKSDRHSGETSSKVKRSRESASKEGRSKDSKDKSHSGRGKTRSNNRRSGETLPDLEAVSDDEWDAWSGSIGSWLDYENISSDEESDKKAVKDKASERKSVKERLGPRAEDVDTMIPSGARKAIVGERGEIIVQKLAEKPGSPRTRSRSRQRVKSRSRSRDRSKSRTSRRGSRSRSRRHRSRSRSSRRSRKRSSRSLSTPASLEISPKPLLDKDTSSSSKPRNRSPGSISSKRSKSPLVVSVKSRRNWRRRRSSSLSSVSLDENELATLSQTEKDSARSVEAEGIGQQIVVHLRNNVLVNPDGNPVTDSFKKSVVPEPMPLGVIAVTKPLPAETRTVIQPKPGQLLQVAVSKISAAYGAVMNSFAPNSVLTPQDVEIATEMLAELTQAVVMVVNNEMTSEMRQKFTQTAMRFAQTYPGHRLVQAFNLASSVTPEVVDFLSHQLPETLLRITRVLQMRQDIVRTVLYDHNELQKFMLSLHTYPV